MSPDSRRRRHEATRRRVEQAAAEQRRADRNRRLILGGGALVSAVVLVALIVLIVVHHDSSGGSPTTTVRATTASDFGSGPCPKLDGSSPRKIHFTSAPKLCIDPTQHYVATFNTTAGQFAVTLDAASAPVTVNNFVVLALYHYYDGTVFHRAIPGYIVQGGDADGSPPGTGSPGYTIADEFPSSLSDFTAGSVAMANSGAPHSGANQFFVWLGPNPLPSPSYSLFGKVVTGLDVVRKIEATGSPTGTVATPVTLATVTIGTAAITSR